MKLLSLMEFKTGLEYHDELNPVIWSNDALRPDVKAALDKISSNFVTFLGIDKTRISDIAITGSNCNYNYSPQSDIDLHVVADYSPEHKNHLGISVQDAFNSFKTLYNQERHITVHGFPIEVYVQPSSEHFTSNAGVYSLMYDTWKQHPEKVHVDLDNREIQRKAIPIMKEIDEIVAGKFSHEDTLIRVKTIKDKIKQLRGAGLASGGEFGTENLTFKAIRNAGYLEKLSQFSELEKDHELSI
jgi:hypothetical protein